jgi:sarcosine oxidase/sarcosine oxidase subunit beta
VLNVAIIGAGIYGLCLAWALHKRGAAVTVFEQGPIPSPLASSFDEHRITRHTYGDLSGYGEMMPAAFAAYEALWADLGVRHLSPSNIVYICRQVSDLYQDTGRDLDRLGIAHRPLSVADVSARLPMLRADGMIMAFEAEGAGMLFASRIVVDLAGWLGEAGVGLRPNQRVSAVDPDTGRIVADGAEHAADLVIIAAGAWLPKLYPPAAHQHRLVASRQTLLYLEPPESLAAAWKAAPVMIIEDVGTGAYILPPRRGTRLKIGDHHFTRRGAADDDRTVDETDIAPIRQHAQRNLSAFNEYRLLEARVCYYTVAGDARFVVEPIGARGWVLSACSGHGFKLAALVASGLADALTGSRAATEIPAWAAGRSSTAAVPSVLPR